MFAIIHGLLRQGLKVKQMRTSGKDLLNVIDACLLSSRPGMMTVHRFLNVFQSFFRGSIP